MIIIKSWQLSRSCSINFLLFTCPKIHAERAHSCLAVLCNSLCSLCFKYLSINSWNVLELYFIMLSYCFIVLNFTNQLFNLKILFLIFTAELGHRKRLSSYFEGMHMENLQLYFCYNDILICFQDGAWRRRNWADSVKGNPIHEHCSRSFSIHPNGIYRE